MITIAHDVPKGDPVVVYEDSLLEAIEDHLGKHEGHPEACRYTIKADSREILIHLLTHEPECDGFTGLECSLSCACCRNNSDDPDHRHSEYCSAEVQ